jgi:DNA-binding NtrC family response regulator
LLGLVDHGDVPTAVPAIKAGTFNSLEKSIEHEQLPAAMDELLDQANPRAGHLEPAFVSTEVAVL